MAVGIKWPQYFLCCHCTLTSQCDLFNLGDKLLSDLAALLLCIDTKLKMPWMNIGQYWSLFLIWSWAVKCAWRNNVLCLFVGLLFVLVLIWFSNMSSGLQQTAEQLEFEKAAGREQSFAESAQPTWPHPPGSPRPPAQQASRASWQLVLQGLKVSVSSLFPIVYRPNVFFSVYWFL